MPAALKTAGLDASSHAWQDLQLRVQGSAIYVRDDILAAIDTLERGVVRAADIVTAVYALGDAPAAFDAAAGGRHVKVALAGDPSLVTVPG